MATDLEQLLDMGFEKARAELAVKKSGGCRYCNVRLPDLVTVNTFIPVQGALQWLEDNQDKPLDELQAEAAAKADDGEEEEKAEIAALEAGQANSLVCNECGKKFRNKDLASFHASKT